jgi:FMN phosphatase YigB (HAD superfamily)
MEDELKDKFNVKSPFIIRELVAHWNSSITINEEIMHMLVNLRDEAGNRPKIALLSNIGIEHAEMMEDVLSEDFFFERSIKHFSCFVGARKPSALYYQSFLMQYPEFQGSLYVDDLQENLDAGAKFGFKPYKFDLNDGDYSNKILDIKQKILES